MGFVRNGNEYREGTPVVLVPATTRTAAGAGAATSTDAVHTLRLTLGVTAISGAGASLAVTVETSEDGAAWRAAGTFDAATAPGSQRKSWAGLDRFVRCTWALAGTTPSATFSVAGEAI